MIRIRRDHQIHAVEGGWFTARCHLSFSDYRDPAYEWFG